MAIALTRQELYEKVWQAPVNHLSAEFGLSDVGLAKLCRRHQIPVPPRGFWAKKQFGHRVKQAPLPRIEGMDSVIEMPGAGTRGPAPDEGNPLHPLIAFERDPTNLISVSEDLRPTHRLIRETRAYWRQMKTGTVRWNDPKPPHLNIHASKGTMARALRITQALLVALEHRGFGVKATTEGKTVVTLLGQNLELSLKEPSRQTRHVPTPEEVRRQKQYSWESPRAFDIAPSGELTLTIDNVWSTRQRWRDGKKQRLEAVLNNVIEGLVFGALAMKARDDEHERQRRVAEERERRQQEALRRAREERARVRRLEMLIETDGKHEHVTRLLSKIREACPVVASDTELDRWLRWADDYATRLDVVRRFANRTLFTLFCSAYSHDVPRILANGVRDRDPDYDDDKELPPRVVLTSSEPSCGYGAVPLRIEIHADAVLPYETTAPGGAQRRFAVPADVVNKWGKISEHR